MMYLKTGAMLKVVLPKHNAKVRTGRSVENCNLGVEMYPMPRVMRVEDIRLSVCRGG